MSKKQAVVLLFSAMLLGFLMIQPFNLICRATDKCQPIILSYYLPKFTGKEQYEIFFLAKDRSKEVRLEVLSRSAIIASGADAAVEYKLINVTDHDVKIVPRPFITPDEAAKYIKFYECLCSREHKVKKGESIKMVARFRLDRAIENDPLFTDNHNIALGYEVSVAE